MFGGSLVAAVSYFFLGPSPWLTYLDIKIGCSVMGTGITMGFLGAGLSAAIIPSISEMVDISRKEGYLSKLILLSN